MSDEAEPREAEPGVASLDRIGFKEFLQRFRDTEAAWALLEQDPDAAGLRTAVALGRHNSAVLVRTAEALRRRGMDRESLDVLEQAVTLGGPTAPAQIAYARRLHATGEIEIARRWYRGGLIRARPDIALMLEYAAFEQEAGKGEHATRIAHAARTLERGNADELIAIGRRLADLERSDMSEIAWAEAYRRGDRSIALLGLIAKASAGPESPLAAPIDAAIPGGPSIRAAAASMVAQLRLATEPDCAAAVASARAREVSPRWVPFDRLGPLLRQRVDARLPFSWIRLGDGEARLLLHAKPELRGGLSDAETRSIVDVIWSVWFGQPFAAADPARVSEIVGALEQAIQNASLLGVTSAERLTSDREHRGYCAALERYLQIAQPGFDQLFTDATFNSRLNESNPFLSQLLSGLDFLGVISPHPDLCARLRRQHGIAQCVSYDIPGEGRLTRDRERHDRGQHFPIVYDRLMSELSVPFPGAVFLVAGGLLGKIYCERIRSLGGIAIDIGALADAWVGINTRGRPLDLSMRAVLPA